MNPDVTDTEFVHFEVVAERPRRRRARLPLALRSASSRPVRAVMRLARRAQSNAGRRRPGSELEARRVGRRDSADTGLLTKLR